MNDWWGYDESPKYSQKSLKPRWVCLCGACDADIAYLLGCRARCLVCRDWIIWLRPV